MRVGDWVLATNPETGETRARRVTDVIVGTGPKQLTRVIAAGRQIVATDGHPFYTANDRSWTNAADLKQGDVLVGAGGSLLPVSALIDADQTTTVYNLTVDADHTYYAGDQPVLVHNATCGVTSGSNNALRDSATGRYARNPSVVPRASSSGVHGNSLASPRQTTLYQMIDQETGAHLKWGITSEARIESRYSLGALRGRRLNEIMTGSRAEMAAIERQLVERAPGPENRERYAGTVDESIWGIP